jgi:hypothetical protein
MFIVDPGRQFQKVRHLAYPVLRRRHCMLGRRTGDEERTFLMQRRGARRRSA